MDDRPVTYSGGCNCGAVRYEIRGPIERVSYCHCHQCRRFHGHVGAYCRVQRGDIAFTEERGLKWYQMSPEGRRGFCSDCGASVSADFAGRPHISVTPGTLDDDAGVESGHHIFVAHRGHYYEVEDDLPKYDDYT